MVDIDEEMQRELCARYRAPFVPTLFSQKVGIADSAREGRLPLNGLRHPPTGDTSGWYLWGGEEEPSTSPDFFSPMHAAHLPIWCPLALRFLGLPPGWRFLAATDYEDVWENRSLLEISD